MWFCSKKVQKALLSVQYPCGFCIKKYKIISHPKKTAESLDIGLKMS